LNPLDVLTRINLDDLAEAVGWQSLPLLGPFLRKVFYRPARRFAERVWEFDTDVGECGLADAARLAQRRYVQDVVVFRPDRIPDSAFLALSNHPGMTDTLSLFVALNRPGLKIIALDRPFLNAMPNTSRQLFYVKPDSSFRMNLIRQVTTHLRAGGSALTFPAGHIEPDPDVHQGAVESLRTWTDSAGVFLRMAPHIAVLPVLVRGVVWDRAARHPLLLLKRTRQDKDKLAGAIQLFAHVVWNLKPVTVRVQIGKPIYAHDLGTTETMVIHQAVLAEMKRLIENPPEQEGVSAL